MATTTTPAHCHTDPTPQRTATTTHNQDRDRSHQTVHAGTCETGRTRVGVPKRDRYTWAGYIFGHRQQCVLDYMFVDSRSRERTTRTHLRSIPTFPSDHRAVGHTLQLDSDEWNAAERYTRTAPKPLRWRVPDENLPRCAEALRSQLDDWTPHWGIDESTQAMQRLLTWGRGVPKGHVHARTYAPTDATRRTARTRLQQAADRIRREKDLCQGTNVLHHLRDGGWGAKDVAPPMAAVPYHQETDDQPRVYNPKTIAQRATT